MSAALSSTSSTAFQRLNLTYHAEWFRGVILEGLHLWFGASWLCFCTLEADIDIERYFLDFQDFHSVLQVILTFDRELHDTVTALPKCSTKSVLKCFPNMPHQQPNSDISRFWRKKQIWELQKLFIYQDTSMMVRKRDWEEQRNQLWHNF